MSGEDPLNVEAREAAATLGWDEAQEGEYEAFLSGYRTGKLAGKAERDEALARLVGTLAGDRTRLERAIRQLGLSIWLTWRPLFEAIDRKISRR